MTSGDAKNYLSKREIPQLFECLMTGLMYHRPTDHLNFLQGCLKQIRDKGVDAVRWNMFLEQQRAKSGKKSPLPPIQPSSIGETSFKTPSPPPHPKSPHAKSPHMSRENSTLNRNSPLPPIGQDPVAAGDVTATGICEKLNIPDIPIIFIMGGPGAGKYTQAQKLLQRYEGWAHLSMGDLLRSSALQAAGGAKKWDLVEDLVRQGELAPEDITKDLIVDSLKSRLDAKGLIIEGYPRNMKQVEEWNTITGRVDLVILLDCKEEYMVQRLKVRGLAKGRIDDNDAAVSRRIDHWKEHTISVIRHFDGLGKLVIMDGDQDSDELTFSMFQLFDNTFFRPPTPGTIKMWLDQQKAEVEDARQKKPAPPSEPKPDATRPKSRDQSRPASPPACPGQDFVDPGRKPDMPQCPVLLVMGGPGSGRVAVAKNLADKHEGVAHLSVGDLLRQQMATSGAADDVWGMVNNLVTKGEMAPSEVTCKTITDAVAAQKDAKAVVLEGYPRDMQQVAAFNNAIGGATRVLLVDSNESEMRRRLAERADSSGRLDDSESAVEKRIDGYKQNTFPVIRHYGKADKLCVVDGDQEAEALSKDVASFFEKFMSMASSTSEQSSLKTEQSPVVEEIIQRDSAQVLGDKGNPYS